MIVTAFMLAVLMFIGCWLIYTKFPKWLRRFMIKADLLTDFGAMILATIIMGTTATGLLASGMLGIFISVALKVAKEGWLPKSAKALAN